MGLLNEQRWDFDLDESPRKPRPALQLVENGEKLPAPTFAPIDRKPNLRSAVAGIAVQVLVVVVLVLIPLFLTDQISFKNRYAPVLLSMEKPVEAYKPKIERPRIIPPPVERIKVPPPPKPVTPPKIEPPKIEVKKPEPLIVKQPPKTVELKKAQPVTGVFDNKPAQAGPTHDKPAVRTDLFAGSSAKPTLDLPAHKVQTGGFGDPNGVKPGPVHSKTGLQVATVGSFDLPGGPGHGNGSGGAHGTPGTVRSAGFGNGIASAGGGGGNGGRGLGGVRSGRFGDSTPPVAAERRVKAAAAEAAYVPVQILSKPKPAYTAEARQLKIQGEVLVSVIFGANGAVRVRNVTRGLGHGLDQNAIRAAEQIRFTPARRGGQPVDSNAIVHIVFEMAY